MKSLLLSFMLLACSVTLSAQINVSNDFEAGLSGWTAAGGGFAQSDRACSGTLSFQDNVWSNSTTGSLTSPGNTNTTADEVTIDFTYKIQDFNNDGIADPYDGTVTYGYSLNGGATVNLGTLPPTATCTPISASIAAGIITAGDEIAFHFDFTWGTSGDWDVYVDDFSATQPGACVEATATYTIVNDCANGQFSIDVMVTDPGSATTLTIADDQASATQAANLAGANTFGPYPDGTDVVFTVTNDQNMACVLTSSTQTFVCPPPNDECAGAVALVCNAPAITGTTVDATDNADDLGCTQGPSVWYSFVGAGLPVTITADPDFSSYDIELAVATGTCGGAFVNVDCQDGFDDEIITFTPDDGVTYYVTVGHFSDNNTSTGTFTIELECATCLDPTVTYNVVDDCANDQFSVEVSVTDPGTATSLTITDDQASASQAADLAGANTFGPYAAGTSVIFTTANDQDASCSITSSSQTFICPPPNDLCSGATPLVCNAPAINGTTLAATDNADDLGCTQGPSVWYSFVGMGVPVTITADPDNSSYDIELAIATGTCGGAFTNVDCADGFDDEIITFTPDDGVTYYVTVGHFSDNNTSTGTFTIELECETCTDPTVTYNVVDDCANNQFSVEVSVTDPGSATSLTITDDQASASQAADLTLPNTFGPYASGVSVIFTTANDQDASCTLTSAAQTFACPPPNDACANAIALTDANGMPTAANGARYNSTAADPAVSEPAVTCDGFTGNADDDLWFTVTAPTSAGDIITILVDGTSNDEVIVLYSGDCNNLVQVACEDTPSPETLVYEVPAPRQNGANGAAAETFYVQVYDYADGGGEFDVTATVQSALPVELISFTGQAMEKANKLTWTTASEEAADRYVVERSSDASDWSAIGEVLAAGDSETELNYELMDESPLPTAYYRLRMVDLDGTFTFSNIVELTNSTLTSSALSIYPVPAVDQITVSFEALAGGQAQVLLTDLTGRTISEQKVSVTTGQNAATIDLQQRASGIYLVRVNVGSQQMIRRVIKR